MNDGYLLADCVFNYFFGSGFMHNSKWKHESKELYYTASFFVKGTRASTVSFEVIVSGDNHKVTKSIIRLLEKGIQKILTLFL